MFGNPRKSMKEKIKKVWLKIKKHLSLLLVLTFVGGMVLGLYCFSRCKEEKEIITASADSSEDYYFNYVGYENANLLPYPYLETTKNYRGIQFDDYGDGRISIRGTAVGYSSFILCNDFSGKLVNGQAYTFSSGFLGENSVSFLILYYTANGQASYLSESTFVWNSSWTFGQVYIQIPSGQTVDGVLCPMFVKGTEAKPFIPNLQGVFLSGYNGGYSKGYSDITAETKEAYRVQAEEAVLADKETFLDGIFALVDAPFNAIRNILDFEIFGIDISQVVFFFLTASIVVLVLKKMKGG